MHPINVYGSWEKSTCPGGGKNLSPEALAKFKYSPLRPLRLCGKSHLLFTADLLRAQRKRLLQEAPGLVLLSLMRGGDYARYKGGPGREGVLREGLRNVL
jgi:hypothetical protein